MKAFPEQDAYAETGRSVGLAKAKVPGKEGRGRVLEADGTGFPTGSAVYLKLLGTKAPSLPGMG